MSRHAQATSMPWALPRTLPARWMRGAGGWPPSRDPRFVAHARLRNCRTRIVLAGSVDLVRAGLRAAIEANPQTEVVGEARDGREAITLVQAVQPDLLVLDAD